MKTRNLLLITLAMCTACASAAPLSPEDALARALSANTHKRMGVAVALKAEAPVLRKTIARAGTPAVYVFDRGGDSGYLVVSADDNAEALLGYSDHGNFDSSTIPPALGYWLDQYASQVQYAATAPKVRVYAAERPARAAIAPLTTTHWNQNAPFNNDCPEMNGERSVTGCVATALAQVMKYHNWPAKGTSSHSYTWNNQTLTVDYANTTYDWANMLNDYTSSATAAQNAAVATLMYSCGVAVDMSYSPQESGAASFSVPAAMINYFGYDKGVHYVPRNCYGLYDWEDLVYTNLRDYGPVQYSGQSSDGGHSFVCDGYSADGYFHINWGWGGMSDGYFLLTALDPGTQGIGGSSSGYNYDQDIIFGVTRPGRSTGIYEQLIGQSGFTILNSSVNLGTAAQAEMTTFNFSTAPISGTLGFCFTPVGGGTPVYGSGQTFSSLPVSSGFRGYAALVPASLTDGTYTVTPVFMNSAGEWQPILTPLQYQQSAMAVVANGVATFTNTAGASVEVDNVTPQTPFYIGMDYQVNGTVRNTGQTEYVGAVTLALIGSRNDLLAIGNTYPVDVMRAESADIEYASTFRLVTDTTLTAGNYHICFVNADNGRQLSDLVAIELKDTPAQTRISATQPVVNESDAVDATSFMATSTVKCEEGYFGSTLMLAVFPYSTGSVQSIGALSSGKLFIDGGASKAVTFKGALTGAEAGKQYMCAIYSGQEQLTPVTLFTVKGSTAVDDIATATTTVTDYYNMQGIKTSGNNLTPGMYIKVTHTAGGTKATRVYIR